MTSIRSTGKKVAEPKHEPAAPIAGQMHLIWVRGSLSTWNVESALIGNLGPHINFLKSSESPIFVSELTDRDLYQHSI